MQSIEILRKTQQNVLHFDCYTYVHLGQELNI